MELIDISQERFSDYPATLNGEILVKETFQDEILTGYLAISREDLARLKTKSSAELAEMGWGEYINEIETFVLPINKP